jgi:hypothetical protein
MRVVTGILGAILGVLLALIGLFLVLYQGEEGSEGDTWVDIGGRHVDADYVGGPTLAIGLAAIVLSLLALRRSGVP